MPRSTAWRMAAMESLCSCAPQPTAQSGPPMAHAPKPTGVMCMSVRPSWRVGSGTAEVRILAGVAMGDLLMWVLAKIALRHPSFKLNILIRLICFKDTDCGEPRGTAAVATHGGARRGAAFHPRGPARKHRAVGAVHLDPPVGSRARGTTVRA